MTEKKWNNIIWYFLNGTFFGRLFYKDTLVALLCVLWISYLFLLFQNGLQVYFSRVFTPSSHIIHIYYLFCLCKIFSLFLFSHLAKWKILWYFGLRFYVVFNYYLTIASSIACMGHKKKPKFYLFISYSVLHQATGDVLFFLP